MPQPSIAACTPIKAANLPKAYIPKQPSIYEPQKQPRNLTFDKAFWPLVNQMLNDLPFENISIGENILLISSAHVVKSAPRIVEEIRKHMPTVEVVWLSSHHLRRTIRIGPNDYKSVGLLSRIQPMINV